MRRLASVLVTGGAGFVGSTLVKRLLARRPHVQVVTLDALTYAGSRANLDGVDARRHTFVHGDVRDVDLVRELVRVHDVETVIHAAAESHVDRSIAGPMLFLRTNVEGTAAMLEALRAAWGEAPPRLEPRFHQVSTDEVYGDRADRAAAREGDAWAPSSPYAASKASADHLVAAWRRTYGLRVSWTWGSNTLGAHQVPEKLIPLAVHRMLAEEVVPVYGDGLQERDWIHVDDHADGILAAVEVGAEGRGWNLGSGVTTTNRALLARVCAALDGLRPDGGPHDRWLTKAVDRPGHDRRYHMDASRARDELGWSARPLDAFLPEVVEALAGARAPRRG